MLYVYLKVVACLCIVHEYIALFPKNIDVTQLVSPCLNLSLFSFLL